MTALVFGGAASGKSEYGEKLVCSLPRTGELIYLATMEPFGPEAEVRIRRHRELRACRGFSTLERARDLADQGRRRFKRLAGRPEEEGLDK